jgi:hypothetical protein
MGERAEFVPDDAFEVTEPENLENNEQPTEEVGQNADKKDADVIVIEGVYTPDDEKKPVEKDVVEVVEINEIREREKLQEFFDGLDGFETMLVNSFFSKRPPERHDVQFGHLPENNQKSLDTILTIDLEKHWTDMSSQISRNIGMVIEKDGQKITIDKDNWPEFSRRGKWQRDWDDTFNSLEKKIQALRRKLYFQ